MTQAAPSRVRTVFVGTGSFAVPALRALAVSPDVDLVGVVTAAPRPAGRRGELRPSPVAGAAAELGLTTVLAPERLRRADAVASVLGLRPDLLVLADYGQIVPRELLELRHGALNLHPSLLPRHRGASPVPATILAGDPRTGVALIRMDEGLDTGPLVAVEEVELAGHEVAPDLEATLAERGAALLVRCLPGWLDGSLRAAPQPSTGATLTRPLRRDDGRLAATQTVQHLERQVRAFQPWPGAWVDTDKGRLAVRRVRAWPEPSVGEPGAVRTLAGALVLVAADGSLELREVQPAGGAWMAGTAFVRGRPSFRATVVPGLDPGPIERAVGSSGSS